MGKFEENRRKYMKFEENLLEVEENIGKSEETVGRKYKRVVPELVLILSERTCNAIYRNFDEVRVFCSTLHFQEAPKDI